MRGLREEENRNWQERRKKDELMRSLLAKISDDGEDLSGEVEESVRLGAFEKGKNRPLKIKLKSQVTAEFLLQNSWKLKDQDETKGIYVRRNMTEQERENLKDILKQAREKNEERTEEEKLKFFWRVRNEKLKKWWINRKE